MSNHYLQSGRAIAKALGPSERDTDKSILSGAALLSSIITAAVEHGVAAEVTQPAVRSAIDALTALGAARDHVVTCHRHLAKLRDAYALDEQRVGCDYGKVAGRAAQPLRSVA